MLGTENRLVVVKVGTSSITDEEGWIVAASVAKIADEVAALRESGRQVVIVTSGAIAAGLPVLGLERASADTITLQAMSAVGQPLLFGHWSQYLGDRGLSAGQVLLASHDFVDRRQYLHARSTLARLLELGVIPVINENDAIADDEIRFGDNDRIAALVAQLLSAGTLVLLTDTGGLFTSNPHIDQEASLIEEITEVDRELEAAAGGAGSVRGSGGMASKLAAAKMASWSGVQTVIADASRPGVLADAVAAVPGVGTVIRPRSKRVAARKLWIGFAVAAAGVIAVDDGARRALLERGVSLLPAGITGVRGGFAADDAVAIAGPDGEIFAKGLTRHSSSVIEAIAGKRTVEIAQDLVHEVVHRDDLVILP